MQRHLLLAVLASAILGLFVRWAILDFNPGTEQVAEVIESPVGSEQAPRVLAASDSIGPLLAVGSEGALVFTVDSSSMVVHSGATLDIQGRLRASGSVGDAGQVLTSGGADQPPAWKNVAEVITGSSTSGSSGTTTNTTTTNTTDLTQTATSGNLLIADGDSWESVALGGDAGLTSGGTLTIAANAVALTTDTTGNYVATIAATSSGTLTVTNGSGEGSAVTLDVKGVNCTDCLDVDQIEDIYVLNSGDEMTGTLSLPTLTLTGTGTINGLDAIDSTTEDTLEAALDIAGDISGTGLTAVTIGADKVLESHLKAVDTASDEECLTYETTTGDFEWQSCGAGGGMTSFTLAGDTGSSQTISDGNTLTIATGAGLTATAGATDTVTLSVDSDGLDFAQFEDTLDLDAATEINAGAFDFSIDLDSTGDFIIKDAGTAFVTFTDTSGVTFANDLTMTDSTPLLTVNSTATYTVTDGTDSLAMNFNSNALTWTSGSNSFTFDADTGPVYAGGARPTRQVTLSPEFPGASLTGDGGSNTGTMTSDFCENGVSADIPQTNTGVCNTSADIHNYYSWTTAEASAQDYDVWIRWRVPDNFSGWAASNPVKVYGKRTDTTNNSVKVYVYDTAGTLENASGTEVAGNNVWAQTSVESSFGGTYTAGSYMTIRIALTADTGGDSVQAGEINLDYLVTN